MTDKERETPTWNPPEPPWSPEPEPFKLTDQQLEEIVQKASKESGDVMPIVDAGLAAKIEEMVEDGDLKLEPMQSEESSVDAPDLLEYTVKCSTGITVNGKFFTYGSHSVSKEIYETLSTLDDPY